MTKNYFFPGPNQVKDTADGPGWVRTHGQRAVVGPETDSLSTALHLSSDSVSLLYRQIFLLFQISEFRLEVTVAVTCKHLLCGVYRCH